MEMEKDKVYFARKYGLAERDIAPEFLPLLIAFDDINEQNRQLSDKIKGSIVANTHEHYYEGMAPFSALLLRWGWGVWVMALGIFLGALWFILQKDRAELAELRHIVAKTDSTGYRISSQDYRVVNDRKSNFKGIELLMPKDK